MDYVENGYSHRYIMSVAELKSRDREIKEQIISMSLEELETYKNRIMPHGFWDFLKYTVSDKWEARLRVVEAVIEQKRADIESLEKVVDS